MKLEKLPFVTGISMILVLFFGCLVCLGFFFDIPTWFVYGAGATAFICSLFWLIFNLTLQRIHKRAGKALFPRTSDELRPIRILQGIIFIGLGITRWNNPVSLTPTFASKYASNDVIGFLMIALGLICILVVQYIKPQIVEQGLFGLAGRFHPWEEVERFTWEAYAKRLIFHLKGKDYRKVVFENVTQEMQLEIAAYLAQHLQHTQKVSK